MSLLQNAVIVFLNSILIACLPLFIMAAERVKPDTELLYKKQTACKEERIPLPRGGGVMIIKH